jgi:surfactin synthase thioesterase subunit
VTAWLPFPASDGLPLYCLPHAGGGASAFRGWLDGVPGVAVRPVQPPGREGRFREPPHDRMGPLVSAVADVIPTSDPYAVYGHSLGALVAFELVRELRRRGEPLPVHLVVSGCAAPRHPADDLPLVGGMSDVELVGMLRALGGTPEWLLADRSVLAMVLPAMRGDFGVKETYSYAEEPPLDVPLTVLASTDDPRASHRSQQGWEAETSAEFALHTLAGGHFAVFEQAALTHKHIAEALHRHL